MRPKYLSFASRTGWECTHVLLDLSALEVNRRKARSRVITEQCPTDNGFLIASLLSSGVGSTQRIALSCEDAREDFLSNDVLSGFVSKPKALTVRHRSARLPLCVARSCFFLCYIPQLFFFCLHFKSTLTAFVPFAPNRGRTEGFLFLRPPIMPLCALILSFDPSLRSELMRAQGHQ